MPRQMRRAALRCALSEKASDSEIVVVDEIVFDEPKTRMIYDILHTLAPDAEKYLVLVSDRNDYLVKSVKNLTNAVTLHANYLNINDLATYDKVVMPLAALEVIKSYLGAEA